MKHTFHCMVTSIGKTIISEWRQILGEKTFVLSPAGKTVQSLQNGILHFCVTTLCLHCRKDMRCLSSPLCRMIPRFTLQVKSRGSCWTLSLKKEWWVEVVSSGWAPRSFLFDLIRFLIVAMLKISSIPGLPYYFCGTDRNWQELWNWHSTDRW